MFDNTSDHFSIWFWICSRSAWRCGIFSLWYGHVF